MGSALQRTAFLALLLAAAVAIAALAVAAATPASGADLPFGRDGSVGVGQDSCSGDVSITVQGLYDRPGYTFKDPPNYSEEDNLGIFYQVNYSGSCEFNITVELRGSVSDAVIGNTDAEDGMACLTGCDIADVAGSYLQAGWDLENHPNTEERARSRYRNRRFDQQLHRYRYFQQQRDLYRVFINIVNEEPAATPTPTAVPPTPTPTAVPPTPDTYCGSGYAGRLPPFLLRRHLLRYQK